VLTAVQWQEMVEAGFGVGDGRENRPIDELSKDVGSRSTIVSELGMDFASDHAAFHRQCHLSCWKEGY
jgi:hypothetical protein